MGETPHIWLPHPQPETNAFWNAHARTKRTIKKGGSTQSRLNLTNHHYKEPQQNSSTRNANNGVVTLILLGRSTSHQGAQHGQVGKIFMQIIGFGRLQTAWSADEARVVHDMPKAALPDLPLADMLVTIHS